MELTDPTPHPRFQCGRTRHSDAVTWLTPCFSRWPRGHSRGEQGQKVGDRADFEADSGRIRSGMAHERTWFGCRAGFHILWRSERAQDRVISILISRDSRNHRTRTGRTGVGVRNGSERWRTLHESGLNCVCGAGGEAVVPVDRRVARVPMEPRQVPVN